MCDPVSQSRYSAAFDSRRKPSSVASAGMS